MVVTLSQPVSSAASGGYGANAPTSAPASAQNSPRVPVNSASSSPREPVGVNSSAKGAQNDTVRGGASAKAGATGKAAAATNAADAGEKQAMSNVRVYRLCTHIHTDKIHRLRTQSRFHMLVEVKGCLKACCTQSILRCCNQLLSLQCDLTLPCHNHLSGTSFSVG